MDIFLNILKENLIPSVIVAALFLGIYLVFKVIFKKWLEKEKEQGSNSGLANTIHRVINFVILLMGVVTLLEVNGFDVTGAVAGLGIASVVVGIALQDALKDIVMGFHIIVDKFYKVGDYVYYNGELMQVVDFNLKTTRFYNIDNPGYFIACNRLIESISLTSEYMGIVVPVAYEEPMEHVDEVFKASCKKISKLERVIKAEYAGLDTLGDSAMNYRFKIYCEPVHRPGTRRAALRIIKEDMDKAGIVVPFNQLDVHLDK